MACALTLVLGLGNANRAGALFPLTPLPEEFDALKTLENVPLFAGSRSSFKAVVLRHAETPLVMKGRNSIGTGWNCNRKSLRSGRLAHFGAGAGAGAEDFGEAD